MIELARLLKAIGDADIKADAVFLNLATEVLDGVYRSSPVYESEFTDAEADYDVQRIAVALSNPKNWPDCPGWKNFCERTGRKQA
ncbi:MAG: hypothetical protein WCG80_16960 [Spirochaetales bacterium]